MRRAQILASTLFCLGALSAAEFHVATGGDDAADGRSPSAAVRTIQVAVDRAGAGDVVHIHAGLYRQSVAVHRGGTSAAPLVIRAAPGETAIITGSQAIGGWTAAGGETWRATWATNSQMVLVDGAPLKQIGPIPAHFNGNAADGSWMLRAVGSGVGDLVRGSFICSGGALYVRLPDGGDPNGHLLEAASRPRLLTFDAAAQHVRVDSLRFRHSNVSLIQQIGAAIELGSHCVLANCEVRFCDFAAVSLGWERTGAQVIGCDLSDNGDCGIQSGRATDVLIRDTVVARNNWRGFNAQWHAGGIKLTTDSWGLIERVEAHHNKGNGIWFDYCDDGNPSTVRACSVHDNTGPGEGLISEGSRNIRFIANLLVNNERRGIYVSASDDIQVLNNTIIGTRTFAAIDVAGMPRGTKTLTNVRVADNILCNNLAGADLRMVKENGTDIVNLRADHNLIYRAGSSPRLWWGNDARGGWVGTTYYSVAAFAAATPHGAASIEADPRCDAGWRLLTGSPAIDAGVDLTSGNDHLGRLRPVGAGIDLGAFEFGAIGGDGGPGGTPPPANTAPTVARAASAQAVSGERTIRLTALGADDAGEPALTYRWTQLAGPSPLTFVRNGDNAAQRTAAIAARAGLYRLRATITDAAGLAVTSDAEIELAPVASRLAPTPTAAWIASGDSQSLAATALDQFEQPMTSPPAIGWVASGGVIVGDAFSATGGTHTLTATGGGASITSLIAVVPTFTACVDFLPPGAMPDDGCVADTGSVFAARGNGLSYGWNLVNTTARDRSSGANRRDDTLIHLQKDGSDARWEIAVPNGAYHVRVCAGDPTHAVGRYQVMVEGTAALDLVPGPGQRWGTGEVEVMVLDGRLTVGNGANARGNKLCWIELSRLPDATG